MTLQAVFTFEKDTKNTRRFTEVLDGGPAFCGTIYVQRWALEQLGKGQPPERIRVTVEVAEPAQG